MEKSRLDSRMSSMRYCMDVAKYLDDSPQHFIPLPSGASDAEIQQARDQHRLSRKNVAHMLNAIVLEIAIKVIWELDNNEDCRYTHNICSLFGELREKSRGELTEIYDGKLAMLARVEGTDKRGQRIKLGDLVQLQSLQEALVANEDTMKNFKYDGDFNGKSSAMGSVIWSNEILWTIPPLSYQRIPEALYHYTMGRVEEASSVEDSRS